MPEEIHTGGLKKFVRPTGYEEKLEIEPELAIEIDEGYVKAEERKRRERRIKLILIFVLIILVFGVGGWLVLG